MIGNTIVEYFLSCLYENPLIRAETLNSAAGRDGMGKILLVFVAIIKSYLFHSDIWDLSRRYPAMWYKRYRDIYWRRYKIQETLYIGQWHFSPLQTGLWGPHTVLPVGFGIPRSASSSRTISRPSLLIAACTHSPSQVFCLLQAFQNVDHCQ